MGEGKGGGGYQLGSGTWICRLVDGGGDLQGSGLTWQRATPQTLSLVGDWDYPGGLEERAI